MWQHTDIDAHKWEDEWWFHKWADADSAEEVDEVYRQYEDKDVRRQQFMSAALETGTFDGMIEKTSWPGEGVSETYCELWLGDPYGVGQDRLREKYFEMLPHAHCGDEHSDEAFQWPQPHMVVPEDVVEEILEEMHESDSEYDPDSGAEDYSELE